MKGPFDEALKTFLDTWNLRIVRVPRVNSRRVRDFLNKEYFHGLYAAGKANVVYLVRPRFRKTGAPFVLRITKEPHDCWKLRKNMVVHNALAKNGMALDLVNVEYQTYVSPFAKNQTAKECFMGLLLPFAPWTLLEYILEKKYIPSVAKETVKLVWGLAKKGYLLGDFIAQNIVVTNREKVFLIDIDSTEIFHDPERNEDGQKENAKKMWKQFMNSLKGGLQGKKNSDKVIQMFDREFHRLSSLVGTG